jgi:hypothetical protein
MSRKDSLIARLTAAFDRWENLLAKSKDQQLVAPCLPGGWSAREVILHLTAWQQISVARMQAALDDRDPTFPGWLGGADPFYAEEHTTEFNARILELYREESWSSAHRAWREGFLRLIELSEALPEHEMFDANRYPWLKGYAPSDVVSGSCEHHEGHLEELSTAFKSG